MKSNNNSNNNSQLVIKPLSQNDLADGWRLVVPLIKSMKKDIIDDKGNKVHQVISNLYRSKINLAQLPYHLWKKCTKLNNGNIRVRDNSHHYNIEPTSVDESIIKLGTILHSSYDINKTENVKKLLNILKENDVYGWVVISANEMYIK
jgi:hypothetical protein